MSYSRKVFLGTFSQTISRVVSILVGVISVIFLTRYLGPSGYGQFNTVIVFVSFLSILGDLGVQSILVRELAQKPEEKEKILGNIFVWRIISAVLMFGLIIAISRFMPYDAVIKMAIIIEALRSAIYLFRNFLTANLQWQLRMDLSAWGEIIGRVIYLLMVILVVRLQLDLIFLFLLMFISLFVELIYIYICFKKTGGVLKPKLDTIFLKIFLKESIILGFAYILGNIHHQVDTLFLSVIKPKFDVGIYGAAYHIFQNMVSLPGIFLIVIFPRFSEMAHKKEDWHRFFNFSLFLLWLVALPLALFIFIFAPYIVKIVGGGAFVDSVLPLRILGFALIGAYVYAPFAQMAIALRRQKQVVLVTAIAVFINVGLNLFLIPRYTYNGAAAATLISETCAFIAFLFLFRRSLKFSIDFLPWVKALIPLALVVPFWLLMFYLLPFNNFMSQNIFLEFIEIALIFVASVGLYAFLSFALGLVPKKLLKDIVKPHIQSVD